MTKTKQIFLSSKRKIVRHKPKTFAAPTRALAATSDVMPALRKTEVE